VVFGEGGGYHICFSVTDEVSFIQDDAEPVNEHQRAFGALFVSFVFFLASDIFGPQCRIGSQYNVVFA